MNKTESVGLVAALCSEGATVQPLDWTPATFDEVTEAPEKRDEYANKLTPEAQALAGQYFKKYQPKS